MAIVGSAAAAVAGVTAAAAYLDAKYNIHEDLSATWDEWSIPRQWESRLRQKRQSVYYHVEDQVQRLGPKNQRCIWYRPHPSQQAITYNWTEMWDNCHRWSNFLIQNGVGPGEMVATYLQNSPEFMFNMVGCWGIASAPALINYNLAGDSLIHCLKVAMPSKLLIVDDEPGCRERIEASRERLESELGFKIIILDDETKRTIFNLPATRPGNHYRDNITALAPAFLVYTSGTTGFPKACAFHHSRIYMLGAPRLRHLDMKVGDVFYDCMPMYHGTGGTVAIGSFMGGTTLAIGKKFSTRNFWRDIHDSGANCFVYVGETARYLLAAPPGPYDTDHKLKSMFGNGMRPDVFEKFMTRFNVPTVAEFFNSTEGMFGLLNTCRNSRHVGNVGHHGALLRWRLRNTYVPVKVDHDNGDAVWRDPKTGYAHRMPYEEGGEMLVAIQSEDEFKGYWNNTDATKKRFEHDVFVKGDVWYRTGDALRRDKEGRWFFLDRLGDTFRWKSENVSTAEVAEKLGEFPGLVEANVYGVEIPKHDGRAGCAAVYIRPDERERFDYAGLLAYARKALPKYAVPVFLRVIQSPTPSHNNKQNKVPLRKEGVDLDKIRTGQAGPNDVVLWQKPSSNTYETFTQDDWKAFGSGQTKL